MCVCVTCPPFYTNNNAKCGKYYPKPMENTSLNYSSYWTLHVNKELYNKRQVNVCVRKLLRDKFK